MGRRWQEAYSHFARAVELDPTHRAAQNNLAVTAVYLGRLTEAIDLLQAMV